jgi:hypothetical protein
MVAQQISALNLYFMPSALAFARGHSRRNAIFLLNLLPGWTVIGWIVGLIYARRGAADSRHCSPNARLSSWSPFETQKLIYKYWLRNCAASLRRPKNFPLLQINSRYSIRPH